VAMWPRRSRALDARRPPVAAIAGPPAPVHGLGQPAGLLVWTTDAGWDVPRALG